MEKLYPHIPITREQVVTPRRKRPGFPGIVQPANLSAHGKALLESLHVSIEKANQSIDGFDERLLFKIQVNKSFRPDELEKIPGIELVSQEEESIVIVFATEGALEKFEARLSTLAKGGKPTRKEILYALQGFDALTEEDRTGWALKQEGLPDQERFYLDIELWPISKDTERAQLQQTFEVWLQRNNIRMVDAVRQPGLLLYRVEANRRTASLLLRHRDVRVVDLPPHFGLERSLLTIDIQSLAEVSPPSENASKVTVLDSGLINGHPLLKSLIGDTQSFLPGMDPQDSSGHGTHVAGIAVYGDIERCLVDGRFIPELRLFSGRILDENNENNAGFIENHVEEAVRYFHQNYGCRIFNLSFGDRRKPYMRGHLRGLAFTLDTLARELGVLFVVPTGNFEGADDIPQDWRTEYPDYLLTDEAVLLDPAPALNALTVGSIARWDQTFNSQRYATDPAEMPIARHDQPSPFTRRGPSVNNAIKPELVAYGGNWAVNARTNGYLIKRRQGLGELSTFKDFTVGGRLFAEDCGTSFATPHIAHLAARIQNALPEASSNLIRALLVAHARHTPACKKLFDQDQEALIKLCGYGQIQEDALFFSTEQQVSLFAEDSLADKQHHFYEIPVPEDFLSKGKRLREITVALAYCPAVRTTRIDYKASSIDFRLVIAESINQVTTTFNSATTPEDYKHIPELSGAMLCNRDRSKGTVQACTWYKQIISGNFKKSGLFVVVTRNDPAWGSNLANEKEAYALVIYLRDRQGQNVRLYTQIQNRLRTKVRQRARV